MTDRRFSSAAERNRGPILEVLRRVVAPGARVLEIACGSGQHAVYFASQLPCAVWQPTDVSPHALASTRAARIEAGVEALAAPHALDVTQDDWGIDAADVILCVNMIHVSPWSATQALMRGAGALLPRGGHLITYGPYKIDGAHTAPSNAAFDASIRGVDERWGVRDLADIRDEADAHGLSLVERVTMPANNFTLIFQRR